ncbi:hypothetical protein FOXG_14025 [Fusarium oxysporum f. sp. lycopersici 4287]|uniref:Uncharacterized protein n=2 Tax=Fusarium oxysporum TaxID=5507 RepID=A0A0J9WS91_FUSO4|nr:hypothetical protein FOXG_12514 [Fusarium oxysporum f. sp. lycopersici 4287]XP_018253537.1 hypothetical protein FOXG_14025 [Fusarium oxysporum f. sp. lycopersici 4287]KNB13872.1 hypothetical protein FOXG_12514 [Fusarium oxysporum f. sp. lycopersici 4287]KNB15492.1 hypothetical protein FOXG_14025 [Fusarium oxysporum f. sp. lycopersici 4287]
MTALTAKSMSSSAPKDFVLNPQPLGYLFANEGEDASSQGLYSWLTMAWINPEGGHPGSENDPSTSKRVSRANADSMQQQMPQSVVERRTGGVVFSAFLAFGNSLTCSDRVGGREQADRSALRVPVCLTESDWQKSMPPRKIRVAGRRLPTRRGRELVFITNNHTNGAIFKPIESGRFLQDMRGLSVKAELVHTQIERYSTNATNMQMSLLHA